MSNKWAIDPMHSEIEFKVKHLMISTLTGKFTGFSGEVENDAADFSDAKINFSAEVSTINTGNEQRDGHLQSEDFFNAAAFPTVTFASTGITKTIDNSFTVAGDLNIRGVSKNIELTVVFNGLMTDPYGNEKAGFELSGKISRKDFGLTWSVTTEAGGIVVSDEVKLLCNVQIAKIA